MVLPNVRWHSVDSFAVAEDNFPCQLVSRTMINCHVTVGVRNLTGFGTVNFSTSALCCGANYLVTGEYVHGTVSL
jgi:hypothetical protein